MIPDPIWPIIVLAVVTAVDAVLCLKPVAFIAQCFTDVRFPRRYWWIASPIKFAAVAGLIAGIWIPFLALFTTCCLIAYFVVAIAMHIRARDLGRNLFVNASGMLLLCLLVLAACFLW
ncbi:DoxX family protein [Microbacterium oxydans]|uniref:DoxX family protein n=1 Tax=Microbacterium oxydans TaxID=82380 RepID=UPI003625C631